MIAAKRTIEADDATAAALESRAAEEGLSVSELLADLVALQRTPAKLLLDDPPGFDRQWAAIKAGEPTVPDADVARWLDAWGTPAYRPWDDFRPRER